MSNETTGEQKPEPSPQPETRAPEPKIQITPEPKITASSEAKTPAGSEPKGAGPSKTKRARLKFLIIGLVVLLALFWGAPRILHGLNTVSTDDAYVNSHVTFVAPRVPGQVLRVLVDDNSRVRKADVLVELDPEPYRVQVAIKQAAVEVAKANLVLAEANVRGLVAQARSQRFKLRRTLSRKWITKSRLSGNAWRRGRKVRQVWHWRSRSLTAPSGYSRARW